MNLEKEEKSTKECPKCHTDIPAKASKCPNCQSDLRKWFRRHPILSFIAVVVLLMVIFGSGNSSNNNKSDKPIATKVEDITPAQNSDDKEGEAIDDEYSLGDTIAMKDWSLVVNSANKKSSYGYHTPKTGKEYVIVNVTISNNGDEEKQYIGTGDFKVQDSSGLIVSSDYIGLEDALESYFGLAPGGVTTGSIAFEVPEGDNGLKLIFQPNFLIDKERIVINL